MGLLTFTINLTLDGCVDHNEGSATRKDFPWNNSHRVAGDLRTGAPTLKESTDETTQTASRGNRKHR